MKLNVKVVLYLALIVIWETGIGWFFNAVESMAMAEQVSASNLMGLVVSLWLISASLVIQLVQTKEKLLFGLTVMVSVIVQLAFVAYKLYLVDNVWAHLALALALDFSVVMMLLIYQKPIPPPAE